VGTTTYEDDTRGTGLGSLEEVPDPPGPLAHQHLVKLGPGGVEEWHAGLAGHSSEHSYKILSYLFKTGRAHLLDVLVGSVPVPSLFPSLLSPLSSLPPFPPSPSYARTGREMYRLCSHSGKYIFNNFILTDSVTTIVLELGFQKVSAGLKYDPRRGFRRRISFIYFMLQCTEENHTKVY
jgi:hypothetical protein